MSRDLNRRFLSRFDFVPCRSDKNFLWNLNQTFWSLFEKYHCSCPSTIFLVRVVLFVSEYHWSWPSTAVLVRVPLFLSEYHWSCSSTIVLARVLFLSEYNWSCPSTIVLVRVPLFLSEYHCSCPNTAVLVRVPLFLSEYHCSCPGTIVLVRLPLFLSELPRFSFHFSFHQPYILIFIYHRRQSMLPASLNPWKKNKDSSISYYNVCMQFVGCAAHKLSSCVQWTLGWVMYVELHRNYWESHTLCVAHSLCTRSVQYKNVCLEPSPSWETDGRLPTQAVSCCL